MKNIIFAVLSLMMFSSALADNVLVPESALLTDLPAGSRILLKRDISFNGAGEIFGKYSGIADEQPRTLKAGEVLIIDTVEIFKGNLLIYWASGHPSRIWFSKMDGNPPETVADFNRRVRGYLQIIGDDPDPYPGMEKSMVVDIVMAKIMAGIKEEKYKKILPEFAFLEKQGVNLPESFYYYYTEALDKSGERDKARTHASDYLKKYGKKGKYYQQAVEIMSRL